MSQSSPAANSRVLGTLQALILFIGGLVGASFAISGWAGVAPSLGIDSGTTAYQLLRTVVQFAGFVAPVLLFVAAAGDRSLLPFTRPTRRDVVFVAGGFIGLYALQYGLLTALGAVDVVPVENQAIDPDTHAPVYFLWMMLVSVLVVGPAEELLFRGAIQGLLKRAWGAWPAIIGAAALFGSLHYSVGSGPVSGALAYVFVAFVLGTVLGVLYERSETLVVPVLAHGLFNATAYGIQYLSVVG